jgi:hypothetical protein
MNQESLVKRYSREVFFIDERILLWFRVGLGLSVSLFSIYRIPSAEVFYSDLGVYPRWYAITVSAPWAFSLNYCSGHTLWQILLFSMLAMCGLAICLGYRSRFFLATSWIFIYSIQVRNPMVVSSDKVLSLMIFWSMFLRLDTTFAFRRTFYEDGAGNLLAAAAVKLQFVMFMMQAGLVKILYGYEYWIEKKSAITYSFLSEYSSGTAQWFGQFPEVWRPFTPLVPIGEATLSLLILVPEKYWRIRLIGVVGLACMLLSFHFLLEIGNLVPYTLVYLILFIPKHVIDMCETLYKQQNKLVFLADRLRSSCTVAFIQPRSLRVFVKTVALIILVAFLLMRNIDRLQGGAMRLSPLLKQVERRLNIPQSWSMFDKPSINGGWYSAIGTLENGSKVDVWNNSLEMRIERPSVVSEQVPNNLWRKYLMAVRRSQGRHRQRLGSFLAQHLCREWQRNWPDEKLKHIEIFYHNERRLDESSVQTSRILIASEPCG